MSAPLVESLRVVAKDHCEFTHQGDFFQYFRQSSVLRYLVHCDAHDKNPELAECIQEQGAAYMRLFAITMAAYENMAMGPPLSPFGSISEYLFISCAFSSVDAMAALLVTILTGKHPQVEDDIAGVSTVERTLGAAHPVIPFIRALQKSSWYRTLRKARHRVQHRGFWPLRMHDHGNVLVRTRFTMGKAPEKDWLTWEKIDLQSLAISLIYDLEAWELSLIPMLDQSHAFAPDTSVVRFGFKADYMSVGSFLPSLGLGYTRSPKDNPATL